MVPPWEHRQPLPMLRCTMAYMNPNSSRNIGNTSSFTNKSTMMYWESGYHILIQKNAHLWEELTTSMNNYPGLTWEFNAPTDKVDFMDLKISIKNRQISTSLLEKPLNLHLYMPPHSVQPPGLLPGIVHSTIFRMFPLCSDHNDRILLTKVLFK